ncbi:MAG: UbiX family flavin prenyltransferase, partial [Thermoplasmataceae archaeon]
MKDVYVVGITGGSGSVLGIRLLENLKDYEVHLVISESANRVLELETDYKIDYVESLATHTYDDKDIAARISSGSFKFNTMVIIPCSISTLGKISSGISDTLITRSAAVALKERRRLILVPREMPLSTIVLENMYRLSRDGAIIAPAIPGYYNRPKTSQEMIDFVVSR